LEGLGRPGLVHLGLITERPQFPGNWRGIRRFPHLGFGYPEKGLTPRKGIIRKPFGEGIRWGKFYCGKKFPLNVCSQQFSRIGFPDYFKIFLELNSNYVVFKRG